MRPDIYGSGGDVSHLMTVAEFSSNILSANGSIESSQDSHSNEVCPHFCDISTCMHPSFNDCDFHRV